MQILALVSDAYGGRGGIARFNREILAAFCSHPSVEQVIALPRLVPDEIEALPPKLEFLLASLGGKLKFIAAAIRAAAAHRGAALVFCGHINLLGIAFLCRMLLRKSVAKHRVPVVLMIHGIDAWNPTSSRLVNWLAARAEVVISVSEFTRTRFWNWSKPSRARSFILPNCIDLGSFSPGPKSPQLLARHNLSGRKVLLTVARLSAQERYKGIDEVLQVLPRLIKVVPDLTYLIVGDGDDRARLQRKSEELRLGDHVLFVGRIAEAEKVDYYRLADAFIMAGWGEGFGIVYLEAMACGIPVVASTLDASQEALLGGKLGELVNPRVPDEIADGVLNALRSTVHVPDGLEHFSRANFCRRTHTFLENTILDAYRGDDSDWFAKHTL